MGLADMTQELHLIADTNIFFECKNLEDLPWQDLDGDPVVILLTKPVLDEIDKHKRSNGRTRDRALKIFTRVRTMIKDEVDEGIIRLASPQVILRLLSNTTPDPTLDGALDYTKNDDRLVGILSTLNSEGGAPVQLLTHDTGPASSAKGFGLPCYLIPDQWLRPPQQTKDQKAISELKEELDKYKTQEPKITGTVMGPQKNTFSITRQRETPLTATQIDAALKALEAKHPMRINFDVTPPKKKGHFSGRIDEISFGAPSQEEVETYQESSYPKWLGACRRVMEGMHEQGSVHSERISVKIKLRNEGTRPALNAYVDFRCEGGCLIYRPSQDEDAQEADTSNTVGAVQHLTTRLPLPPEAPKFTQSVKTVLEAPAKTGGALKGIDIATLGIGNAAMKHLDALGTNQRQLEQAINPFGSSSMLSAIDKLGSFNQVLKMGSNSSSPSRLYDFHTIEPIASMVSKPHDPEGFYYKHWREGEPLESGGLTCDRWRHHSETEIFELQVIMTGSETVNGVMTCSVHAENLTDPFELKVAFKRRVEERDLQEDLNFLVENC
ncbi:MAG: hypothetical protein IME92_07890 [Proteobacteria bacterium]|nr:hypothetical protein [Pseudomonadota bacterium]